MATLSGRFPSLISFLVFSGMMRLATETNPGFLHKTQMIIAFFYSCSLVRKRLYYKQNNSIFYIFHLLFINMEMIPF